MRKAMQSTVHTEPEPIFDRLYRTIHWEIGTGIAIGSGIVVFVGIVFGQSIPTLSL